MQMNTNVLATPSPESAKYWSELKDLSDNVKLELITLLSSSMTRPESPAAKLTFAEAWALVVSAVGTW